MAMVVCRSWLRSTKQVVYENNRGKIPQRAGRMERTCNDSIIGVSLPSIVDMPQLRSLVRSFFRSLVLVLLSVGPRKTTSVLVFLRIRMLATMIVWTRSNVTRECSDTMNDKIVRRQRWCCFASMVKKKKTSRRSLRGEHEESEAPWDLTSLILPRIVL